MHWGRILALSSLLTLVWTGSAGAKDYHLDPTSKWILNYADDSCQLSRAFGSGDDGLAVQFIRYAPSAGFDLHLIGKPLGRPNNGTVVRVRFGQAGEPVRTTAVVGNNGDFPALFLSGRLDNLDVSKLDYDDWDKLSPGDWRKLYAIEPATEAAVRTVTFALPNRTISLNLGSMASPMAALRKCNTDLVRDWGLDPAEQEAKLAPPRPKSNPSGWFSYTDYPPESLQTGQQAIIRVRLMIDAMGVVTSCNIQSAIAKGDFAKISCDVLKRRARFEPARSASGNAIPSVYVNKVIWLIGP